MPESSCSYYVGHMECRCAVKARPLAAVHWRVDGQRQVSTSPINISLQYHMVEETWSTAGATDNMSVTCMVNNPHGHKELLLPVFVKGSVILCQSPVFCLPSVNHKTCQLKLSGAFFLNP